MDDRKGVPLRQDLIRAIRGEPMFSVAEPSPAGRAPPPAEGAAARRGLLLALEGGEGAGKTTQATLLSIWLRDQGYDVVTTQEPGGTKVGMRMRAMLLDTAHAGLDPRAETLMYAADRAEHVRSVIRPGLDRGAIVVTDRYVDSSLAYQGAGRCLPLGEVTRINRWATDGLTPDLTILLDLPPTTGLHRRARSADRLESEPEEFHNRVRAGFRQLADAEPGRYLVLDATQPSEVISREIQRRVRELLPDPVPPSAEAVTSTFPAVAGPARAGGGRGTDRPGENREAGRAATERDAQRSGAERDADLGSEAGLGSGERERDDAAGHGAAADGVVEDGAAGGGAVGDSEPGRVGGGQKPGRTSAG
jgi:dTMP kinase